MPLLAINHHYFRERVSQGGIYPSTPASLGMELKKLREKKWKIADQEDVSKYLKGEIPRKEKLAVLTFDDGFQEQIHALEYLKKNHATGICFVPTAPLASRRLLDVHKLQMIRSKVTDDEIIRRIREKFDFDQMTKAVTAPQIQYRYDDLKARKLKFFVNFSAGGIKKTRWLGSYFTFLFGREEKVADKLYLSREDLRKMSENNQLGSHCHSHVPLKMLTSNQVMHELALSMRILTKITGIQPRGVSYPYGSKVAVGAAVFQCAKKCGYEYGFTMKRGQNTSRINDLCLNRIDCNDLDHYI